MNKYNLKLLEKFKKIHQEYLELVDRFPTDRRKEVLFDKWSLKEVLSHMIAWNELDALRIETLKSGQAFDWVYDLDEFNEVEIKTRKDLSWEEIYNSFVESGFRLIKAYKSLPNKMWNMEFGPDNSITAAKDLRGMVEHYGEEHIPQLKKVMGIEI